MAEIHGTEYSNLMEASAGEISGGYHLESVSGGGPLNMGGSAVTTESFESYTTGGEAGEFGGMHSVGGGGGEFSQYLESYSSGVGGMDSGLASLGGASYGSFESEGYSGASADAGALYSTSVSENVSAASGGFGGAESALASYAAGGVAGGQAAGFGGGFSSGFGGGSGAGFGGGFGGGAGGGEGSGAGPLLPINLYRIQKDPNPAVITRPLQLPAGASIYRQNINVRFLKPPTPPTPGPLIIREVRPPQPRPAPPIVIRQRAPRPKTPPPIILRERPPAMPIVQKTKVVIRKLAALPPPERQVIVERYRALPPKPQDIIIERWIPYGRMPKRRVIVQRAARQSAYKAKKNVIIEYVPGPVRRERVIRNLGVISANPMAYASQHGATLLESHSLISTARRLGVVENISPPMVVHAAGVAGGMGIAGGMGAISGGSLGIGGGAGLGEFASHSEFMSGGAEGGMSSLESYESSVSGGVGGMEGLAASYESGAVSGLVGSDLGSYGQTMQSYGGMAGLGEVGGSSSYEYSSSGLVGGTGDAALHSVSYGGEAGGLEGTTTTYESSSYSVSE